jgi:prephenate dehydrogenase
MNFSKITIIGLGLIGGSLAGSLKKSGRVGEVFGVDFDGKALDYAVREGIIDHGSKEIEKGANESELIVIATHVGIIPKLVQSITPLAAKGTIITDVGSVKGRIVKEIDELLPSHLYYVGGHPIAGREYSGVWASDPRLFDGKRCILTPTPKTHPEALAKVKNLWESVGAVVFTMDAETHDRVFSFVSHLPHLVAYALVNSVDSQRVLPNLFDFAGGGLRDYTRIGASSPEMWADIFLMNKENLLESIREFKKSLEAIEEFVRGKNLIELREELNKAVRIKQNMDN